jgi:hypothetical protein
MKVVEDVAKNIRMLEVRREISLRTLGTNMELLLRMIQLFQKKYDKHGIMCIIMNIILNKLLLFSYKTPKLQTLHEIVILILNIFKRSGKK